MFMASKGIWWGQYGNISDGAVSHDSEQGEAWAGMQTKLGIL